MTGWLNIEMLKSGANLVQVFIGNLKEWCIVLAQYRQTQLIWLLDVNQFTYICYVEFLGSLAHIVDQARDEFFKLKCCSFNSKNLEKHFKKACAQFYILKGVDDPNLKQVYLNQLPEPLGNKTLKFLEF